MIYLSFSQQLDLTKNLRCYSEMYMFLSEYFPAARTGIFG